MRKRPRTKFVKKAEEKIEYVNVSYRLPAALVSDLKAFVDSNNSACAIVRDALTWAISDMKAKKNEK